LTSSIPQLESNSTVFKVESLGDKVNTNSWLKDECKWKIAGFEVYMIFAIKCVKYETIDNGSFSDRLIPQKDDFVFCQR